MTARSLGLGAGLGLALGQVATQGLSFLRNVIVMRGISAHDAGIGAILGLAMYLLEMLSDLGTDSLLIQAKDGDEHRFQATAQLLRVVRGLLNAGILLLLAGPLASLFGIPEAHWAFQCLAISPLIRGFQSLDSFRLQRHLRFKPGIVVDLAAQVLPTIVAWPLVHWLGNYSALLWIMVLQVLTQTLTSHWVAERRYALTYDRNYARRMVNFGWPLLINGVLMFGIFEGDKFLIGAAPRLSSKATYTLGDVGMYHLAFGLTLMPTFLVARVGTSILLPMLSRLSGNASAFAKLASTSSRALCLAALLIAVPLVVAGGCIVTLLYGQKFAGAGSVIGWLAAMQAVRVIRVAPTLTALARGDTVNAMAANLARTLVLPVAFVLAMTGKDLVCIAATGAAGEILALTTSCVLLKRRFGDPVMVCLRPSLLVAMALAVAGLLPTVREDWSNVLLPAIATTLLLASTCAMMGGLRASYWRALHGMLTCSAVENASAVGQSELPEPTASTSTRSTNRTDAAASERSARRPSP